MIFKRAFVNLLSRKWMAIVTELAIVTIGVFIGIQASNFNIDRQERALEHEYRERIVGDLDAILANAANQRDFEVNKTRQVAASLALTLTASSEDKTTKLGQALVVTTARLSPNFESPTFNDLAGSGRLSLIRDPILRRDLTAYFARLQYLRTAISRNNDYFADPLVVYLRSQNIGAGFTNSDRAADVPLAQMEKSIASVWLERFGSIDVGAQSSNFRLPLSAPFWEGLRANLSWRGYGAVANENLLRMIIFDARKMRAEVERR